jgi:hypothetical protein
MALASEIPSFSSLVNKFLFSACIMVYKLAKGLMKLKEYHDAGC